MSQRNVKIAIAATVLYLLASIGFFVVSTTREAQSDADGPAKTERPVARVGPQRSAAPDTLESSSESAGEVGQAGVTLAERIPLDLAGDDGLVTSWEGTLAGTVAVKDKALLPDDVTLSLVLVKAYEDPSELPEEPFSDVLSPEEAAAIARGAEVSDEQEDGEDVPDFEPGLPVYLTDAFDFEELVSPGEYKLIVRAPGHLPAAVEGITLRPGEEVRGLVIELEEGLEVKGYVRTDEEAETLEGVEVTLEGNGYRQTRHTDEHGAFEFGGIPEGTYQLEAFDSIMGSATATARAGETTVALRLGLNELSGTVVDESGQPLPGIEVAGRSEQRVSAGVDVDPHGSADGYPEEGYAELTEQYASTDEQGRFTLRMPTAGAVTVAVQAWDNRWGFLKDVPTGARDVVVRAVPGAELRVRLRAEHPPPLHPPMVDLTPVSEDSPFHGNGQAATADELAFNVPPVGDWVLSFDASVGLEVVGELPPNVKLNPTTRRRRGPIVAHTLAEAH